MRMSEVSLIQRARRPVRERAVTGYQFVGWLIMLT